MKKYKMIIVLLFALLSITAVWLALSFKREVQDVASSQQSITNAIEHQTTIAFIRDDIWVGRNVAKNIKILDEEINNMSSNKELRQRKVKEVADQFLQLEIDVEKFVKYRSTEDAFILYLRALASRIRQNGGSEDETVEFFFKGLEKYKTLCLMSIPNAEHLDEKTTVKWEEALRWLRGSLYDNLNNMERHLFDSYLIGISEEQKPNVKLQFTEYYTRATQELARVEFEDRRRRDNRARLRIPLLKK
jgi:hypothetical protein